MTHGCVDANDRGEVGCCRSGDRVARNVCLNRLRSTGRRKDGVLLSTSFDVAAEKTTQSAWETCLVINQTRGSVTYCSNKVIVD